MDDQPDKIYKALDMLCEALDLKGEFGTESLFLILAGAFSKTNVTNMLAVLDKSHAESLCYDMRGPITDKIMETYFSILDHDVPLG
jgi:hypothetical protein